MISRQKNLNLTLDTGAVSARPPKPQGYRGKKPNLTMTTGAVSAQPPKPQGYRGKKMFHGE